MLLLHVVTSVGMMGSVASFFALALAGVLQPSTSTTVYPAMQLLTQWLIVPLAVASLVLGIIQALGTPWGLLRHYWVTIKLLLTIVILVVLLLQISNIEALSRLPAGATLGSQWASTMVLHSGGGFAVLLVALVLSIYRPKGLTRYGWNRQRSGVSRS